MMELVEREPALQMLRQRLQAAGARGHVVLVAGASADGCNGRESSVWRAP